MKEVEYKKYQHLERFGTEEVLGIEIGRCYIFAKLDGTNASIFLENGELCCGSRTRVLSEDKDNAGFFVHVHDNQEKYERALNFLEEKFGGKVYLYGEWLVPHSFKDYQDKAWRNFYVFDVYCNGSPIRYEEYSAALDYLSIDYVPCVAIIENGGEPQFIHEMEHRSSYLCKEGISKGEGIVIKNYDYVNKYGRTTWAKIVSNEFKVMHQKAMGAIYREVADTVECQIAKKYCTVALCEKEYEKIKNESGWQSKDIPRLLNTVYYSIVKEDAWEFVKEHKNPTINFKSLQQFVFHNVKQNLPKLF